ncbi:SET and MYND domain-containing protein 5 isoform X2 [Polypterus senegalus]|uniref:SET and MYND domain-containing protein 5 isoform X2 n=1 Tax=Polypterus senegalus TaxID=55291 RepID=UPI0019632DE0|nr:SET and MYND domain-containing protein 5 isoform X2 [Polypterus senegalus]
MAAPVGDVFRCCVDPAKTSQTVEVRLIDNVKGRGLFAKKAIRKGDTLFMERPLVSAQFLWNSLYNYKACEYCLCSLETAEENARRLSGNPCLSLPHPELCRVRRELHDSCPQCQMIYCSSDCRRAALEQYHQVLCLGQSREDPKHPLNKLEEAWRNMHYPPETASIMLMAKMVATVKQARDKVLWQNLFSQFCSRTANEEEEIAHKLLGEKFQGQLGVLRQLFTSALYDEHLSRWFTPEGFRSLFALVGTNGQGIGTSSLSQWVHACDALELQSQQREQLDSFIDQLYKDIEKETGDFLNCEGSGLFLLQSSCNHSCIPNAEASFPENNFLLHLTALSDIKQGEEICISYLDCCQRDRSRHSRHKILSGVLLGLLPLSPLSFKNGSDTWTLTLEFSLYLFGSCSWFFVYYSHYPSANAEVDFPLEATSRG